MKIDDIEMNEGENPERLEQILATAYEGPIKEHVTNFVTSHFALKTEGDAAKAVSRILRKLAAEIEAKHKLPVIRIGQASAPNDWELPGRERA